MVHLTGSLILIFTLLTGCVWISGNVTRRTLQSTNPDAPIFKASGPWYVLSSGIIDIDTTYTSASTPGIAEDPKGKSLTITAYGTPTYGSIVNAGNKITYTPSSANSTGRDQFTVTITNADGLVTTSQITLHVVTAFTWTGGSSNTWDNTTGGNWCGAINTTKTACTNTGTVPGAANLAVIDDTCSGSNCSPTFNYNISVQGLKIGGSSLTQGTGRTLTVGASGFTQTAGIFTGSNANIIINGDFNASGGSFTSTSTTLEFNWTATSVINVNMGSGWTFHHGSGRTDFTLYGTTNANITGVTFYDVYFYPFAASWFHFNSSVFTVARNLTLGVQACGIGSGQINGATINVEGDLISAGGCGAPGTALVRMTGSNNTQANFSTPFAGVPNLEIAKSGSGQVTMVGTMRVFGHFLRTSGTLISSAANLVWMPSVHTTNNLSLNGQVFNDITIGNSYSADLGGSTITANGNLTLWSSTGGVLYPVSNGTVEAKGNITLGDGATLPGLFGQMNVLINGTGAQTLASGTGSQLPNVTVDKAAGTLTLSGTIQVEGSFIHLQGAMNVGVSTIRFVSTKTSDVIRASGISFYNVELKPYPGFPFDLGGTTLTATNDMLVDSQSGCGSGTSGEVNNGVIESQQHMRFGATFSCGILGNAALLFSGTAANGNLSAIGNFPSGTITVNKLGRSVVLTTNVNWSNGQSLTVNAGSVNMAGFNLTIPGALNLAGGTTVVRGGAGVLSVGGAPIPNGAYSAGNVVP